MIHMEKLYYSSCNEDATSEFEALAIGQNDNVLCITGSGARVLDLLTQSPNKIIAVDCNLSQQNLLKFKAAAIQQLSYDEFSRLLGLVNASANDRMQLYQQIKYLLDVNAQQFWDDRSHMIKSGILFQGEWERYFKRNARLTYLMRNNKQEKLFQCKDLSEQADYWKKQWTNGFWQLLLSLCSNRLVWRYLLKDPGFFLYVPPSFNIYQYINDCFNRASENFLFNQSHFAHLLFWGEWQPAFLPPHLQAENYALLKNNIHKICYMNTDLVTALQKIEPHSINKFSLSDFSSYTSISDYAKVWQTIPKISSPRATVCERQFLVKREVVETANIERNCNLENSLEKQDQSIFYSFIIATINI